MSELIGDPELSTVIEGKMDVVRSAANLLKSKGIWYDIATGKDGDSRS